MHLQRSGSISIRESSGALSGRSISVVRKLSELEEGIPTIGELYCVVIMDFTFEGNSIYTLF